MVVTVFAELQPLESVEPFISSERAFQGSHWLWSFRELSLHPHFFCCPLEFLVRKPAREHQGLATFVSTALEGMGVGGGVISRTSASGARV